MASNRRPERLRSTIIPSYFLIKEAERYSSSQNHRKLTSLSSEFAQVESLVALTDCDNNELRDELYDALSDALFFRLIVPEVAGPFIIVTEIAWCHGYILAWKMIIPKLEEPDWPDGIGSELLDEASRVMDLAACELYAYQCGYRSDVRVTLFNDTLERVVWCVADVPGMPWIHRW
ncbi:hypothetical protein A9Z42_0057290 [Trichoderma parareesei]|uniref:Uncharacterized protein n=1 Tax=Trichoderma parareesei TaxID=858221 RepID=A0A2H3A178_TRIPA|nr:hypothetical protein A9Z42_0057290 [Trichoderma parareesei]